MKLIRGRLYLVTGKGENEGHERLVVYQRPHKGEFLFKVIASSDHSPFFVQRLVVAPMDKSICLIKEIPKEDLLVYVGMAYVYPLFTEILGRLYEKRNKKETRDSESPFSRDSASGTPDQVQAAQGSAASH